MNIFFLTLLIFVLIYLVLNWFIKTSSAKISKSIRTFVIISSIVLAVIMAYAGRFIFSLPFLMMILPLVKTKAGFTLLQVLRFWSLLRILKNSGRFNFNQTGSNLNNQNMSRDEAYKILNLEPGKKYSKEEILNSYKKIMKKIHPDVSPELSRLASIVNEAKEIVIKDIA
ncbi:DnaJ domain-containing protein [Candidatus Pelagibacter communis]|uniref:DnaJ domain-containing protein n=1 Tax=Pelagibacter ubique TaxID=198252 RepID=UPI00094C199F|nr:DnaJ domain-containing protein [Candidatus Pelagibacter ubique]